MVLDELRQHGFAVESPELLGGRRWTRPQRHFCALNRPIFVQTSRRQTTDWSTRKKSLPEHVDQPPLTLGEPVETWYDAAAQRSEPSSAETGAIARLRSDVAEPEDNQAG